MSDHEMPSGGLNAYRPPHLREKWDPPRCATAWVHAKLSVMKGSEQGLGVKKETFASLYGKAKRETDYHAATRLVDMLWNAEVENKIVDAVIRSNVIPFVAFPHPGFDDEDGIDHDAGSRLTTRNAIPFALAERVRATVDGFTNHNVKQASRVGRSKLARFPRFVFQPSFTGIVDPTRPYILVDDTFTLGGTLATMRSYIRRCGGTVIGVTALAHSRGIDLPFAMTDDTEGLLSNMYGPEFSALWKGEIGHEPARLSDAEGRFLLEWGGGLPAGNGPASLLQQLRARLDRARTHCR